MKTAILVIPSFLHEEMTRHAISPRFAINTFVILGIPELSVGSGGIFSTWPVFCDIFPCNVLCRDEGEVARLLLDGLHGPCLASLPREILSLTRVKIYPLFRDVIHNHHQLRTNNRSKTLSKAKT